MTFHLHNPVSQAHIEDLKDRLNAHLSRSPSAHYDHARATAAIDTLAEVVRALDQGAMSVADARAAFAAIPVPGFHFEAWLAEMLDEGVYVESALDKAA